MICSDPNWRKLFYGEIEWHTRIDVVGDNEYKVTITAATMLDHTDLSEWQEVESFVVPILNDGYYQTKYNETQTNLIMKLGEAKLMAVDEPMIIEKREI